MTRLVTITTPSNGATIIGDVPGEIAVRVQATVTESAIASMTAQVNGGPPQPESYFHTDPRHYNAMVIVDANDGVVIGNNTVILVVRDFERPSNAGTASTPFTFQIKPIPALSQVDIVPTAFEVYQ